MTQPFTLLIKPSGSECNIDCKYCFYKDRPSEFGHGGERESYFCESYRQFFDYTVPRFMQIAAGIKNGSVGRHTRSADKIRLRIEK